LLEGAWEKVSPEFVQNFKSAWEKRDVEALKALAEEAKSLGHDIPDVLGSTPEAVFSSMFRKAEGFWKLHAIEAGIKKPAELLTRYRERIASLAGEQVKAFAEAFPERFLLPEIERQIQWLADTEAPSVLSVSTIGERLERLISDPKYWENLSDVQMARVWHGGGFAHARENGIGTGRITGPLDDKTCPVCAHMLGLHIDIDVGVTKFEQGLEEQDPEKIRELWPFPRLHQVDNISREELSVRQIKNGWYPPFHPHCRHSIAWLYLAKKYDEQQHPRHPAGTSQGGEFAPKEMSPEKKAYLQALARTNAMQGASREKTIRAKLEQLFSAESGYVIHEQCYFCDVTGKTLADPKSGKKRRADLVVVRGDRVVKLVEVTSKKAEKYTQMAKERRIRENNAKVYVLLKGGDVAWIPAKVKTRVWRTEDFS